MITNEELTKAQVRWFTLITEFYPDIVKAGTITHKQLQEANQFFRSQRTVDEKKFKVSWPIWLIMNNAVSRGVYTLPLRGAVKEVVKEIPSEQRQSYVDELASFGL